MPWPAAVLASVPLLLAAAPAQSVASDLTVRGRPLAGPVAFDGGLLWAESTGAGGRGRTLLRVHRPGRRASTLPLPRVPDRGRGRVEEDVPVSLRAAGGTLLLERRLAECGRDVCGLNGSELLAGFPRSLAPLSSRRLCGRDDDAPPEYALAGRAMIYARNPGTCAFRATGRSQVVLRDLSTGGERRLASARAVPFEVRAAGRFVAWRAARSSGPATVSVYDRRTRRLVRRLRRPFALWDLLEDGGVVGARAGRDGARARSAPVWWHPVGRRPRRLARQALLRPPADARAFLQAERGRVAFLSEAGSATGEAGSFDLVVAGLRGGARRVTRYSGRRLPVGEISLSATAIAWAAQEVTGTRTTCGSGDLPCATTALGPTLIHRTTLGGTAVR